MVKKRIYVALLNMDWVIAGLESKLYRWMGEKTDKYTFFFKPRREVPTDSNRNHIVNDMLAGDWDYLFMFDSDTFPLKNPFDLLDFDKDIIGGVYFGWGNNGMRLHVYRQDPKKKEPFYLQYSIKARAGLKQVDAIGAGCMAIKRGVLEKIKNPFSYTYHPDGTLYLSDDTAFCRRCTETGFEIWAHWDYVCSHFKTVDLLAVAGMVVNVSKTGVPELAVK